MSDGNFLDRLVISAQENPLAATLIAGGLLWMVAGNGRLAGAVQTASNAASPLADIAARPLASKSESKAERDPELPSSMENPKPAFSDSISRLKDAAGDGWSSVRNRISDLPDPRPALTEHYGEARTMLTDVLERQPLVLGVSGLGIGAAIASAFRSTDTERELMGSSSEAVRTDLSARASAVADKLRESTGTLKAELSDTGAEALDRLQQAGKDAVGAAREKARV